MCRMHCLSITFSRSSCSDSLISRLKIL
ncbi:MAG: hypothetical protein GXO94_08830 [Nitrospirae bacterium]|nr:hypothetical protein [Nitrospirota bacterium]